uniref:Uncharacterized protein n=1 Tax=Ascaris lumbricoides TaxID=6252 RepID=A0A0M3IQJ9_ASCLU
MHHPHLHVPTCTPILRGAHEPLINVVPIYMPYLAMLPSFHLSLSQVCYTLEG